MLLQLCQQIYDDIQKDNKNTDVTDVVLEKLNSNKQLDKIVRSELQTGTTTNYQSLKRKHVNDPSNII